MTRFFLLCLAATGALTLAAQTPMSLRDCIARAQQRNIKIRQAEVARDDRALQLDNARKAFLPEVNAGAGENLSFGRGLTANNTYESRNTSATSFSLSASMPLYTGGRLTRRRHAEKLRLEAAVADIERLREDIRLQVTQAYYQVLFQTDLVRQAESNLRLSQSMQRRVDERIRSGAMAEIERAQAVSRTAQDKLALTQAENNRALALLELSQLLEYSTPDSLTVTSPDTLSIPTLTGNPEEIYALSLAERPALRAAELRTRAADEAIGEARAGYLPNVSLNAGLGTNFYSTSGLSNTAFGRQLRDNFAQSVGLSIAVPVFDRHATRNSIRAAKLAALNNRLDEAEARKSLFKEIQNAYYNALTSTQKWKAACVADTAASAALHLMARKYEAGKANGAEYDEARTKQTNAATDRITAFYEALFRRDILDFYAGKESR